MTTYQHIVILTGSGVSAESGLNTFRDNGGLWEEHRVEDVATPEAFARDPHLVHRFYNQRREFLKTVTPNAAHLALAKLEDTHPAHVTLITQNVDDLHERAGSRNVMHMHGELNKVRCRHCGSATPWVGDLGVDTPCPECSDKGGMRPHIVWFGEMPFYMEQIDRELTNADLFISIGTSGNVYPAAGFVQLIRGMRRAHTVELNLEPSEGESQFAEKIYGPATEVVTRYVDKLLEDV